MKVKPAIGKNRAQSRLISEALASTVGDRFQRLLTEAVVVTLKTTAVFPLPSPTCEGANRHVLRAGWPVQVRVAALGNVPERGSTER